MKNKAIDLHNILFEQLERLNDLDDEEEMKSEKLVNECRRADAMCKVAAQLNNNRKLVLDAMKISAALPEEGELSEIFSVRALPAPKPNGRK